MENVTLMARPKNYRDERPYDFPVSIRSFDSVVVDGKKVSIPNRNILYREDTGTVLSFVSNRYRLVSHKEASDYVQTILAKNNIPYEVRKSGVSKNGARFIQEITLKDMTFNPGGYTSTALDAKTETHVPTIILKNSYDGSSKLELKFGLLRLICTNGMISGVVDSVVKYKHIRNVSDWKHEGENLLNKIEYTLDNFRKKYNDLNALPADSFVSKTIDEDLITNKSAKFIMEKSQNAIQFEYDEAKKMFYFQVLRTISAYAYLQLLTEFYTHRYNVFLRSTLMKEKIAKIFGV